MENKMVKNLGTYNFCDLKLFNAISHIVANRIVASQSHMDPIKSMGTQNYHCRLAVKEGFYDVPIVVDEDNVWAYGASEITFPEREGKAQLIRITKYDYNLSEPDSEYRIVSEMEFRALSGIALCSQEAADDVGSWFTVENVSANW